MFSRDLKDAYRHILVNPQHWKTMGSTFLNKIYVNCYLPFGIRSAPGIFSRFSDATAWILFYHHGFLIANLLDDFLVICRSRDFKSALAESALFDFLISELGWSTNVDKAILLGKVVEWLGIVIDSRDFSLQIPMKKFEELKKICADLASRKTASYKEISSFLGKLVRIYDFWPSGKTFTRGLYDFQTSFVTKWKSNSKLRTLIEAQRSLNALPVTTCRLFLDGSARGNPGPAGAAFVVQTTLLPGLVERASSIGNQTNNVAEIWAAVMACRWIARNRFLTDEFVLCTDSIYLLGVLKLGWTNLKNEYLIWALRKLVFDLEKSRLKIDVIWVPAHVGLELNEYVDGLAFDAAVPVPIDVVTNFVSNLRPSDTEFLGKKPKSKPLVEDPMKSVEIPESARSEIDIWHRFFQSRQKLKYFPRLCNTPNPSTVLYICAIDAVVIISLDLQEFFTFPKVGLHLQNFSVKSTASLACLGLFFAFKIWPRLSRLEFLVRSNVKALLTEMAAKFFSKNVLRATIFKKIRLIQNNVDFSLIAKEVLHECISVNDWKLKPPLSLQDMIKTFGKLRHPDLTAVNTWSTLTKN